MGQIVLDTPSKSITLTTGEAYSSPAKNSSVVGNYTASALACGSIVSNPDQDQNTTSSINSTDVTTIIPSPQASDGNKNFTNNLNKVSVTNNDTITHTYTLILVNSGNNYILAKFSLSAGYQATYDQNGILIYDQNGIQQVQGSTDEGSPTISASSGSGTSPTVSIVGLDSGGVITVVAGTGDPTIPSGDLFAVTYSKVSAGGSSVVIYPENSNAAGLAALTAPGSTSGFVVNNPNSGALSEGQTYIFNYIAKQF